jgi:hypothetical protein
MSDRRVLCNWKSVARSLLYRKIPTTRPNTPPQIKASIKYVTSIILLLIFGVFNSTYISKSEALDQEIVQRSADLRVSVQVYKQKIQTRLSLIRQETRRVANGIYLQRSKKYEDARLKFLNEQMEAAFEAIDNRSTIDWAATLLKIILNNQVALKKLNRIDDDFAAAADEIVAVQSKKFEAMRGDVEQVLLWQKTIDSLDREARGQGLLPPEAVYDPESDTFTTPETSPPPEAAGSSPEAPDGGINFDAGMWYLVSETVDGQTSAESIPGEPIMLEPDTRAISVAKLYRKVDEEEAAYGCTSIYNGGALEATISGKCNDNIQYNDSIKRIDNDTIQIISDDVVGHSISIYKRWNGAGGLPSSPVCTETNRQRLDRARQESPDAVPMSPIMACAEGDAVCEAANNAWLDSCDSNYNSASGSSVNPVPDIDNLAAPPSITQQPDASGNGGKTRLGGYCEGDNPEADCIMPNDSKTRLGGACDGDNPAPDCIL